METKHFHLEKGIAIGILIEMPNAPLMLIKAKRGYVMCGYLNMSAADKLGDAAGRVTGVKTFDEMLAAKVAELSENAKSLGATEGITGREFLNLMM